MNNCPNCGHAINSGDSKLEAPRNSHTPDKPGLKQILREVVRDFQITDDEQPTVSLNDDDGKGFEIVWCNRKRRRAESVIVHFDSVEEKWKQGFHTTRQPTHEESHLWNLED